MHAEGDGHTFFSILALLSNWLWNLRNQIEYLSQKCQWLLVKMVYSHEKKSP